MVNKIYSNLKALREAGQKLQHLLYSSTNIVEDHTVEIFSKLYVGFQRIAGSKSHNFRYCSSHQLVIVSETSSAFQLSLWDYKSDYW